jgi:hypothetical protein
MLFVGKWIELEIIMLSKISQAQKSQVSHAFTHMENLGLKLIIIIIMIIIIIIIIIMGHECERGMMEGISGKGRGRGESGREEV